jgi:ABC-type polar amino acid transport system ATPase subunit
MRVDIARALCLNQNEIVFDEFTSVVIREIAKVSAYAISKAVRRSKKKFIAVIGRSKGSLKEVFSS